MAACNYRTKHVKTTLKMPRSDEAAMWYAAVYSSVQEIPYGKVTSYGHIASMLGYRECDILEAVTIT